MSSAEEVERISEFQSITGTSSSEARNFLEAHNWDLSTSLETFFDTTQPSEGAGYGQAQTQPSQPFQGMNPPTSMPQMMHDDDEEDDDDDEPWQPMVPPMQSSKYLPLNAVNVVLLHDRIVLHKEDLQR